MGEEVVHDGILEPWQRGGSHDVAAIAARLGWLWRAEVVASLSFVGSMRAPVPALAPPSMCVMVGDVVRLPQAVRRKGC